MIKHTIQKTEIVFLDSPKWEAWGQGLSDCFSVFLHSANYKFSLGSGSSYMVKQIIDAERKKHGKSGLEREIRKIRKTPVGGVRITSGGQLPASFSTNSDRKETIFPNFHQIVHCVLPGPRIENFEQRVESMISEAFQNVSAAHERQEKPLFFVLPVVGINNFGYPPPYTLQLYAYLLTNWLTEKPVAGKILLWLRNEYHEEIKGYLKDELD